MNIDMIEAAARRMSGHVRRTPLLNAPRLDTAFGRRIFVKAECLQLTGSFKIRGAGNRIALIPPEDRAKGVIAFSSASTRTADP